MRHGKIAVAALLCAVLACGLLLSACTGTVTEVKGFDAAMSKAVTDYLKDYVKNNLPDYSYDADSTRIDEPTNDGIDYTVRGVLGLKNKDTDAAASADFALELEFINYAGQTQATFRMTDAKISDPH